MATERLLPDDSYRTHYLFAQQTIRGRPQRSPEKGPLWLIAVCWALGLFVIGLMTCACVTGQPVPCEQQGRRLGDTPAPPVATNVTTGDVTQPVAAANRATIESTQAAYLPIGTVKLDAPLTLKSGQMIAGPATLCNAFTQGYPNDVSAHVTGAPQLGYFDALKVTGPYEFTLADRTQSGNYRPGQPVYLFRLSAFVDDNNQLRTLCGVQSVNAATGKVSLVPGGPVLHNSLTAAKWFTNASFVGDVKPGAVNFVTKTGSCHPGDWVLLTQGPEPYNEGRDEWHRVVKVSPLSKGDFVTLDTPVDRAYSAAVLAVAVPDNTITLQALTIARSLNSDYSFTAKYLTNSRFDGVTFAGKSWLTGSAYCTFTNCTFDEFNLNSCHDCQFIGCSFGQLRLEECCFAVDFAGCVCTDSLGMSTPCNQISFRGCRITGPHTWAGIWGDDCVIDGLAHDGGDAIFLKGDRMRVTNIISDSVVWAQIGDSYLLSNVRAPVVTLGMTFTQSGGVCLDSPAAKVQAGIWKILP